MTPTDLVAGEDLLERLQRAAFDYFPRFTNPRNGLVADNSRANAPVSIAVVGFALSAYPIGVERGWIERSLAVDYILSALRFFRDSDQSGRPLATGFKGFYYHFLDIDSGARVWRSELSMIDTALLIAGMLAAAAYFDGPSSDEAELRELADSLYQRVDWRWAQDGAGTIRQGWKPECGFLHYGWEGYSEAIVLYVLALASPTHPIAADCYDSWTLTYQWENLYDIDCLYAGPLFIHHFSHAWIDFRGIRDAFMREKRSDYFKNSGRAARIQREYARRNPGEFAGYDENCWGLSACDGPTDELRGTHAQRRLFGYAARSAPYGPDDGTLAPASMLASLPFAPDIVMQSLGNMLQRFPEILPEGRLVSGFNPTLAGVDGRAWVAPGHFGLDQGIVLMMIENHRSELPWRLMRANRHIGAGLRGAGFRGGWLARAPGGAQ